MTGVQTCALPISVYKIDIDDKSILLQHTIMSKIGDNTNTKKYSVYGGWIDVSKATIATPDEEMTYKIALLMECI